MSNPYQAVIRQPSLRINIPLARVLLWSATLFVAAAGFLLVRWGSGVPMAMGNLASGLSPSRFIAQINSAAASARIAKSFFRRDAGTRPFSESQRSLPDEALVAGVNSLLRSRKFRLTLSGTAAFWGRSFLPDRTARSYSRSMSLSDATLAAKATHGYVSAATALVYGYGLHNGDAGASRDGLMTGVFNNRWYLAMPVYALALRNGFGRMGNDAHLFSEAVGATLIDWGATELLTYLHGQDDREPSHWRIFTVYTPAGLVGRNRGAFATGLGEMGLGVSYSW